MDPGPDGPKPKPKGAMASAREDLQKRAKSPLEGVEEASPAKPPVTQPKPGETPAPSDDTKTEGGETKTPPDGTKPAGDAKAEIDPKTGKPKVNPWRMVDEYKGKLTAAEAKLAELTKAAPKLAETQDEIKKTSERIKQVEARNKELEDAIRFKDYEQSSEFKEKYSAPYDKAWERALGELRELTVSESGQERAFNAQDMLTLVNLPLREANALATEQFGDLASEVMAHRKNIKNLFEQRSDALKEARTKGAERDKEFHTKSQAQFEAVRGEVQKFATEAVEQSTKDEKFGSYFVPTEGDEDGNSRLTKGFDLVDKAFSADPHDPKLTADQRADIIRKRTAVRFRAAAFGRMAATIEKLKSSLEARETELKAYMESTPPLGGGGGSPGSESVPTSAMERAKQELRARAK